MKGIKSIIALTVMAFLSIACSKDEPVVIEYLDVNANNISGQWELASWNGEALDEPYVDKKALEEEWIASVASPVAAASMGEIDDIISTSELRQRICTSLHLLASKGSADSYRHAVRPL